MTGLPVVWKPVHRRKLAWGLAIASLLGVGSLQAANLTFDPLLTGTGSAGSGPWDLTTANWSTGTADQVWTQTSATVPINAAIFAGTDGASDGVYAVTLGTALSAQSLTFNSTGYSLTAASAQTLTLSNAGTTTVTVANGKTASLGNNLTTSITSTNLAASNIIAVGGAGGGTFNIATGSTVNYVNATGAGQFSFRTATNATGESGIINVAGTITNTATGTLSQISLGQGAGTTVTMNVNSGGAVNSSSTGASNSLGSLTLSNNGATAVLNVNNGGLVNLSGTVATAGLNVARGVGSTGAGVGTVNLNAGGAINAFRLFSGTSTTANTTATSTLNLNGGTLTGTGTTTTFISGLTAVNVLAGGANINTGAFVLTVGQALTASTTSTGGGLTLNGTGTNTGGLILSAANTYTGTTTIGAGTLTLGAAGTTGSLSASSNIVNNGTLAISRTNAVAQGTDFGNVISGTGALVDSAGTLTLGNGNTYGGTTSINTGAVVTVASFNHFASGSIGGGATTTVPAASSSLGVPSSALSNVLNLGGGSSTGTVVYTGTGEVTDKSINLGAGLGTAPNGVIDQSGTGLLQFTGNVTAAGVAKSLVLQGSTAGTGQISGVISNVSGTVLVSLIKAGTGTWTLSGANTFSGGTTVNGGILAVAANGALGGGSATVATTATSLTIRTGVTTPFTAGSATTLTLAGGGTANVADVGFLDLTSGATITVNSLVLGTTTEPAGIYTAANSPDYILGGGTVIVAAVPEPSTWVMLGVGVVGLAVWLRRKRVAA